MRLLLRLSFIESKTNYNAGVVICKLINVVQGFKRRFKSPEKKAPKRSQSCDLRPTCGARSNVHHQFSSKLYLFRLRCCLVFCPVFSSTAKFLNVPHWFSAPPCRGNNRKSIYTPNTTVNNCSQFSPNQRILFRFAHVHIFFGRFLIRFLMRIRA